MLFRYFYTLNCSDLLTQVPPIVPIPKPNRTQYHLLKPTIIIAIVDVRTLVSASTIKTFEVSYYQLVCHQFMAESEPATSVRESSKWFHVTTNKNEQFRRAYYGIPRAEFLFSRKMREGA